MIARIHRRAAHPLVRRLYGGLTGAGFEAWFDRAAGNAAHELFDRERLARSGGTEHGEGKRTRIGWIAQVADDQIANRVKALDFAAVRGGVLAVSRTQTAEANPYNL